MVGGGKRTLYGGDAETAADAVPDYFANYFTHLPTSVLVGCDLIPADAQRVLDVGCALGKVGRYLKSQRPIEVVGLELMTEAAAVAREYLDDVIVADLDDLPELGEPEGSFDAMLCLDVLEHVVTPERIVRHLLRWVRPGGHVIVSVPNTLHIALVAALLGPPMRFQETSAASVSHHLRFFTLADILAMLDALGLQAQDPIYGVGTDPSPQEGVVGDAAQALGGNRERAIFESRVVQYVMATRLTGSNQGVPNGARAHRLEWRPNQTVPPADLGLDWDATPLPALASST